MFASEMDISHYVLDGWEDDFRCVEVVDTETANVPPDEIAQEETKRIIDSK